MLKSFSAPVSSFIHKYRLQIMLTLVLVFTFTLVLASVTAADYDSGDKRAEPAPVLYHCTVLADGHTIYAATEKCTVAELFSQIGLNVDYGDKVSVGLEEEITDDMTVTVTRVNSYTLVEEVCIPYSTIRIEDPELYYDSEVIDTEGNNGKLAVTSTLVLNDDELVSMEETDASWVEMPTDEVIRYGTKPYEATFDASGAHSAPSSFVLSDVPNPDGSGVLTLADGQMINYTNTVAVSATAYTTERQSFKYTYTGTIAHVGGIAVDPKVIPLGTKMYIVAADGTWTYGYATAEDIGGGIKTNKIDLFFDTYNECIYFGVRNAIVYIIG